MVYYPVQSAIVVFDTRIQHLSPLEITPTSIGNKAFGLSCLPLSWTLPYVVISKNLVESCRKSSEPANIVNQWLPKCWEALAEAQIPQTSEIIVRSSSCDEDMDSRGRLISMSGTGHNLASVITECVTQLLKVSLNNTEEIFLIIQQQPSQVYLKGHLSNERRCYQRSNYWLVETDENPCKSFPIQVKNKKIDKSSNSVTQEINRLECTKSSELKSVLSLPAEWASNHRVRLHFEWVWDKNTVFLVQGDQERSNKNAKDAINPLKQSRNHTLAQFNPKVLKPLNKENGSRFVKVKNVLLYQELNLPTVPMYILDNVSVINDLALGQTNSELKEDLAYLSRQPMVIRMDSIEVELSRRQMLPRTDNISDADKAMSWLIAQSKRCLKHDDIIYIFHSFIPSHSSLFAWASPKGRVVQIEALWGLPEGLYYFCHDKCTVNTYSVEIDKTSDKEIEKFSSIQKHFYKPYIICADSDGQWRRHKLAPPFDWKSSIPEKSVLNRIAFESRRIAEKLNDSVSIMWFMGVDSKLSSFGAIPWHHEHFQHSPASSGKINAFDKAYIIQTSSDVDHLTSTTEARIRIQPREESFLRNKDTLKRIGEIAKEKKSTIILEGGILSHAYYLLKNTGAIIEVVHPFSGFQENHEFNKLVRDNIPGQIREQGENVSLVELRDEDLLVALREKLIEESLEVFEALDADSIMSELADVLEVVGHIAKAVDIPIAKIQRVQDKKRKEKGGFSKGLMLLKTTDIPPSERINEEMQFLPGFAEYFKTKEKKDNKALSRRLNLQRLKEILRTMQQKK